MITDKTTSTISQAMIKLGIDAHAKWYYVARQLDGATPQPVQNMDIDGLPHFVAKQQRLSGKSILAMKLAPSATTCTASSWRWEWQFGPRL